METREPDPAARPRGPAPRPRRPRPGETIELRVERLDERGRSVGVLEGRRVTVAGAFPGERVVARVTGGRRGAVEARALEVLDGSSGRVDPRCPHTTSCGGCSFQELRYERQLEALHTELCRTLAGLELPAVPAVLGMASPWHYRNKMDFTFGAARWIEPGEPENAPAAFALGLHARGHYHKVLDVHACAIAFREAEGIVNTARELALRQGLAPWSVRDHTGLLRHLVLRQSHASGEILADLVTTEAAPGSIGPFVRELLARHPEITTLVQHVNAGVALVATGTEVARHHGSGRIEERLADLAFSISAGSFFQTNTVQAERLVELVVDWAAVAPGERVFDLYCGCGVFALALARRVGAERVTGFEIVEAAVADARDNAARNGLPGVRFVAGDLAQTLRPEALEELGLERPAVCVVDPPRAGLHERVLHSLAVLAPARIVYVSCNPRSAARDLAFLCEQGWRIVRVQPVDLFPHTPHLECVFALER
jgi:23S rRNA (uracil1939-C5)-methyltransferase